MRMSLGGRTLRELFMNRYDPLHAPEQGDWQALDESERLDQVMAYHRDASYKLPNELLHATIHVIVENQVALGDPIPVRATLDRLMTEGLDRHDAIHAIGSVLVRHMQGLMQTRDIVANPNEDYYASLRALTAEGWLKEFS
jgi:hypothetical protein